MTLAELLAPVGVAAFLDGHWERAPLLVQPGDPGRFADLLTLADVEALLGSQTFRRGEMRLVDADSPVARADYLQGDVVDAARVFALFQAGATVVFERLDHRWPPLRRLCRSLEQGLGHAAQTNVYLTGGRHRGLAGDGAQGLRRHYDTHDVFVLQVAGTKHWRLFGPAAELPVKAMPSRPEALARLPEERAFDLGPGDLLYLPRGWVHEAGTTEETSLHVTLGVLATTWGDLLAEAVRTASLREPALRRALPRVPPLPDGEALAPMLAEAVAALARSGALVDAWHSLDGAFVNDRVPLLDGQFAQLAALDGLTDESRVGPRPTVILRVVERPGEIAVLHQRGELAFPSFAAEALRFALTTPAYRVGDVPGGLDEAGRLVLVRRLIREGLLVTKP